MKDYSHIKQGMYVLVSDIRDEDTYFKVRDAFIAAGAVPDYVETKKYYYCNRGFSDFKAYPGEACYGWDAVGGLYCVSYISWFGDNAKRVYIDFILNGHTKEESTLDDHITAIQAMGYKVNIEKVAPKWTNAKLNVGDKVMLSADSDWWNIEDIEDPDNPRGITGEVIDINLKAYGYSWIAVVWDNGIENYYKAEDSDLIPVAASYSSSEEV